MAYPNSALETLSREQFVREMIYRLTQAGIEHAGSLQSVSDLEARHLVAVREAVEQRQNINAENLEYRKFIPGLSRYSINGNLAVFDHNKPVFSVEDLRKNHAASANYMSPKERMDAKHLQDVNTSKKT